MGLFVIQSSVEQNIMIPQKKEHYSKGFPGGYVQEPKTGKYRWVVSVDATSLYPSIIMQHNLSPEMLAENHKPIDCTVDSILERRHQLKLQDHDLSMGCKRVSVSKRQTGIHGRHHSEVL